MKYRGLFIIGMAAALIFGGYASAFASGWSAGPGQDSYSSFIEANGSSLPTVEIAQEPTPTIGQDSWADLSEAGSMGAVVSVFPADRPPALGQDSYADIFQNGSSAVTKLVEPNN